MTQTELTEMILTAIAEATAPIEEKMVQLQNQLGDYEKPNLLPESIDSEDEAG